MTKLKVWWNRNKKTIRYANTIIALILLLMAFSTLQEHNRIYQKTLNRSMTIEDIFSKKICVVEYFGEKEYYIVPLDAPCSFGENLVSRFRPVHPNFSVFLELPNLTAESSSNRTI